MNAILKHFEPYDATPVPVRMEFVLRPPQPEPADEYVWRPLFGWVRRVDLTDAAEAAPKDDL
jgi:hypothetical protein